MGSSKASKAAVRLGGPSLLGAARFSAATKLGAASGAPVRTVDRRLTAPVHALVPQRDGNRPVIVRRRAEQASPASAEDIILCTGFAQGMRLTGEVLGARGVRRIAVENLGHAFESEEVRATRLELVPVRVDEHGVCVERLKRALVGAVYVTPAHQYPTGAVLSPARRAALLKWAETTSGFVIEDDYDGEHRYDRDPVGALQGLAPDRVIYIGSISKTLAPALRIGWILSPPSLTQELTQAKLAADRGSPGLEQAALAEFIRCGDLDRHLRRSRLIYKHKRTLLAETLSKHLPSMVLRGVAAGLHLTMALPEGANETALVDKAERHGIRVHGLHPYCARSGPHTPALLLGYCQLSERDLVQGATALAALVKSAAA